MYETFTIRRRDTDEVVGTVDAQSREEAVYRLAGGEWGRPDYYANSEADEDALALHGG